MIAKRLSLDQQQLIQTAFDANIAPFQQAADALKKVNDDTEHSIENISQMASLIDGK